MSIFIADGYRVINQLIDRQMISSLNRAIADNLKTDSNYGVRNLHHKISLVNKLANSQVIIDRLSKYTNYRQFKLIKAIYFNKNLQHNWSVPWHQDKTIAVKEKVIISGYKNWTVKQGVPHVQPPSDILEKLTTIRIALDDTDSYNGALKVIPRSHSLGILNQPEINQITREQRSILCSLQAGDVLMMHPLILHSSNKSISGDRRLTIHLEYSSASLPQDLTWYC